MKKCESLFSRTLLPCHIIESASKSVVAARCKLAGMHWRHANAAGVALLLATLRSNFKIVA